MRAEAVEPAVPAPLLRMLGWTVSVLLVAAALLPLAPRLLPAPAERVLEVSGAFVRVDAARVQAAARPALEDPLQELDLARMKDAVEALPWVAQARVEREWPGTVRVTVWEHVAVARWGAGELLSAEGTVFAPGDTPPPGGLPRLEGPEGRANDVHAAFTALRDVLGDSFLAPARLRLDARGEWTAWTADGIELRLGRQSPAGTAALLKGPVTEALEGRRQEVAYVDLHYINGFAVGWRDGSADPETIEGRKERDDE